MRWMHSREFAGVGVITTSRILAMYRNGIAREARKLVIPPFLRISVTLMRLAA